MAKAFDTVNHELLLVKLCRYVCFRGITYDLIKSYLTNRKHVVKINKLLVRTSGHLWSSTKNNIGTTILYSVHNDTFLTLPKGNLISFGDDTCVIVKDKSWTDSSRAEVNLNQSANWYVQTILAL